MNLLLLNLNSQHRGSLLILYSSYLLVERILFAFHIVFNILKFLLQLSILAF